MCEMQAETLKEANPSAIPPGVERSILRMQERIKSLEQQITTHKAIERHVIALLDITTRNIKGIRNIVGLGIADYDESNGEQNG